MYQKLPFALNDVAVKLCNFMLVTAKKCSLGCGEAVSRIFIILGKKLCDGISFLDV